MKKALDVRTTSGESDMSLIMRTARETEDESYTLEYIETLPHLFFQIGEQRLQQWIETADNRAYYNVKEKRSYLETKTADDPWLSSGDISMVYSQLGDYGLLPSQAYAFIQEFNISAETMNEIVQESGLGEKMQEYAQEKIQTYLAAEREESTEAREQRMEETEIFSPFLKK